MMAKRFSVIGAVSLAALVAGCAQPPGAVTRTGAATAMISATTAVPTGYETIYLSGMTGTLPTPPGGTAPDSGDTEAQAVRALEKIKATLAEQGLTLGDVVMMHAYLAADPATGRGDGKGWGAAYSKFFGTADQPNKPSRSSVTVILGSPAAKIEIETIAVRKPKPV